MADLFGDAEEVYRQEGSEGCWDIGCLPAVSELDLVLDGAARGTEIWWLARLGHDDRAVASDDSSGRGYEPSQRSR
ncbi:hypothetical protein GA0070561_4913 [Micromonospora saelicesensis]|uniref:Uncharacterized protein n=1 Tax=Micromonospora saelicesensis TaxID=285676 RepID=A0A1C4Z4L0_9ACTN|nr:hypothetical protein GA0070561_4913 [Micromonospora saelicesensis]